MQATNKDRVKWWRGQMRDWAMLWRRHGWALALEHAIQNRNLANLAASRARKDLTGGKGSPND